MDKGQQTGQFILACAAKSADELRSHTDSEHFTRIFMRPMSLFESGQSNGDISLSELLKGHHDLEGISDVSIAQIAYTICRGGLPASIGKQYKSALQIPKDYVEAIINQDISLIDGIDKNPARVRALLQALARIVSKVASTPKILKDMAVTGSRISDKTFRQYYKALQDIFVIEPMAAWSPTLRSKTAIRKSSKHHFVDPSIATAVLGATPSSILQDFEYFEFLFEALCARDMRIYSQYSGAEVFHYRDKNGLEADMIITLRDGTWGAIALKLGNSQIEQAAKNLLKLKSNINTAKMSEPAFLMVITAGQYGYKRKDGVLIVPIGCLKP